MSSRSVARLSHHRPTPKSTGAGAAFLFVRHRQVDQLSCGPLSLIPFHLGTPVLPDFPAFKKELQKIVTQRMRRSVNREAVIFSMVRHFASHEGDSFTIHRSDGTSEKHSYRETAAAFTIDKKDLATLSADALASKIDKAAEDMAAQTERAIFEKLRQDSSASGQVINATGKPFSPEILLEILERMDIDFDDQGKPSGLTAVVGPEIAARIREKAAEWDADLDFKRRHSELLDRKREAWRDRENRRKLVD